MKPWETLAEATAKGGGKLVLQRRDREHVIRVDGQVLMTSRIRTSEEALATTAAEDLEQRRVPAPHVLVGGLGLAITLRALLDRLSPSARVTVAELSPAIVAWNRTLLGDVSGDALADPRVHLEVDDVLRVVPRRAPYDAIVMDVDNGPSAVTRRDNHALYGPRALAAAHAALAPNGVYVLWSAGPDASFERRMRDAGFDVRTRVTTSGGAKHVLFIGYARSRCSR